MHHRLRIRRLTALQNNYFGVFSNCKTRMAELCACLRVFLLLLPWHVHGGETRACARSVKCIHLRRMEGDNNTCKHKMANSLTLRGNKRRRPNLAADLFKTMGFNSHIRLFCSHWHGMGKWSENTAEGQNIFPFPSLSFCLCSSQSYCLCIFSSRQPKDNYVFLHRGADLKLAMTD